jgi:hypothetical protein
MASAASPSAADPKMADLCNHTDMHLRPMDLQRMGTSNVPFSQIFMKISGRSVVGFLLVFGLADL